MYYIYQKEEVPTSDTNIVNEAQSKEITNIRLGITNVDKLNPIVSKNQSVQEISKLIYEPLMKIKEDFSLEKCLVTECTKAEEKAYLIKIKEGIKWHNGADFTAEDVMYTIDSIKKIGEGGIYYSNVSNIENVEIVGSDILKIYLNTEEPFFEYNLTFPIICASFFGEEDLNITEKSTIPMGTGMYKIQSLDFNSQIELRRNPHWWNLQNVEPKIESINIKIYSSVAEMYNAYKLGSIDLLNVSRNSNIEENIGTIGYEKKENYGRNFDYLALNCERTITGQKEVRKAINYAIDKQGIINNVYGGKYLVAEYPIQYGNYLYDKDITDYEYNQDKAKQILVDNGWEYKNKYWQKKIENRYERIRIKILVNSANEKRVMAAKAIKNNLEAAGIQVDIVEAKDKKYNNYVEEKNYDILLTGVTVGVNPKLNRYFEEGNQANYTNGEAINILKDVGNITETNILLEKYKNLQKMYVEDRPYIGLYFDKTVIIYGKNLSGTINPNWYNTFYNIENWYRKK